MSGDSSIQEVPKQVDSKPPAGIDASQLQQGAKQAPAGGDAGNAQMQKMGFPDTQISGASSGDRNFNTAGAMSGKGGAGADAPNAHAPGQGAGPADGQGGPPASGDAKAGDGKAGAQPTRGAADTAGAPQGDGRAAKPNQPRQPNDLPTATTIPQDDGSKSTFVSDDSHKNYSTINKDGQNNVKSISTSEGGRPGTTTDYGKDGKPQSETVDGNGSRTWDQNGKQTSDTRTDKSNQNVPDTLKTTQNADGTSTVTSGPGDGSQTQSTFGQDGKLVSQSQESAGGGFSTKNDFSPSGNLSGREVKDIDKQDGSMVTDTKTSLDDKGNITGQQYDDKAGNHSLFQTDGNGNLTRTEADKPSQNFHQTETWDKDGYHSTRQEGNNVWTRN